MEEKHRLLAEAKTEVAETQERLSSQRMRVDELQIKIKEQDDAHEKSLGDTTKRLTELERQLDHAKEENKCAEAALSARNQFMSMLKQSEVQIQDLEGQLKSKNSNISDLQENMEKLEAKLGSQSGELKELASIKSQETVLNDALSSTRTRLAAKESEMDRVSAEIRELQWSGSQDVIQIVARELSTSNLTNNDEDAIARAVQLRRSQSDRIGAIQRLDEERRANKEALQKWRASVTRYCKLPNRSPSTVEV